MVGGCKNMYDIIYSIWIVALVMVICNYLYAKYFRAWQKSRLSKRVTTIKQKILITRRNRLRNELEGDK
jgi:TctA family transporter